MNANIAAPFVPPVPVPPDAPLPLRGFLRAIRTNALTIWPRQAYSSDVVVRHFLGRRMMTVNAPDAIHRVLVDNHMNYRRSPATIRILRPITGQGLLLSAGEAWKLQRRTIAPALAPRVMPMLARHIITVTGEALGRLAAQGPVDLLAAMQTLALEIAGRSMFSIEMQQFGAAMRRLLDEFALRHAMPRLLDMLLPASIPAPADIGRARFSKRWMALIDSMMHARMQVPPPEVPRDLFDLLRAARDPETGTGFSPAELRDQVATLILAGHETTAVTLFWALVLLAQAPEEQQWLADEVRGVALLPETAFAAQMNLPRSRAVVSEALRLFPPAFTVVRAAIGPDRLAGIDLRRGSVVMIAPWVLHRHRGLWREPEAFDPSRFMPDQPAPPRYAYLPFGTGPRVCVGAQFALTEATLVLAALIQRFHVTMADRRPVLPTGIVTTQPDHQPLVHLRTRL
jgi:unspecific monooxygenase